MLFHGHTHLHFGHFLLVIISIDPLFLSKLLNDMIFCQCTTQTVSYLTTIIAIADLF